jgi:hypothetical protein
MLQTVFLGNTIKTKNILELSVTENSKLLEIFLSYVIFSGTAEKDSKAQQIYFAE